jgi:hypothetical protein
MFLGFSKSLGGGFRVGVGTRIGGGRRQAKRGPTKAETAKLEKAQFIKKVANDSNRLLQEFLVNNNIDPSYAKRTNLDIDELFKNTENDLNYKKFAKSIIEIKETVNKLNYGGNLTEKRKETLVDLIFELQEIVNSGGPGLNSLASEIDADLKKKSVITFLALWATLSLLTVISSFFLDKPSPSLSEVFSLVIGGGIFSAILLLPVHFILKMIAKIKYKKRSVEIMKEIYDLP